MDSDPRRQVRLAMLFAFPLTHHDGVSRFAAHLLDALAKDPTVRAQALAPKSRGAAARRPVRQVLVAAEQLWNLLRLRPTAVHVHEHPVVLAAGVIYRLLTFGSTRLIYTIHVEPYGRRSWWKRAILGWLMARCSRVTAVSADTARRLGEIASPLPRNIAIIHGGAAMRIRDPDDRALVEFRERWGLHGSPLLCQIGLNFPLKVAGAERLLAALQLIRQEAPQARLVLIGDGPLRPTVERSVARMGLSDAVVVTGWLDDVSVPLNLADIYCHITLQDACPLSVLEAMQCGKAIVAARTGGIPEILTDGVDGLLVAPEPAPVAQAVLSLLRDPTRAADLGARARTAAQTRFTWERAARAFTDLYRA